MFEFNNFINWLEDMDKIPHTSKYHKESFFEHTLAVAYAAAIHNADRVLFIAALLHDIGKPETVVVREGKGATFYDHEIHIDLIKNFLSTDDEDYDEICELIRYHMLPYKLSGPDPWKSAAEKDMINIIHSHTPSFMSNLFALHDYDMKGTFSDEAPSVEVFGRMLDAVRKYAYVIKVN